MFFSQFQSSFRPANGMDNNSYKNNTCLLRSLVDIWDMVQRERARARYVPPWILVKQKIEKPRVGRKPGGLWCVLLGRPNRFRFRRHDCVVSQDRIRFHDKHEYQSYSPSNVKETFITETSLTSSPQLSAVAPLHTDVDATYDHCACTRHMSTSCKISG
jgi:hypothetical protein